MPSKNIAPGTSTWYNSGTENTQTNNKQHCTHTMNKIKTADKASISNTEAKSTEIGLKETESNKALPAVGSVIDHSVVIF